MERNVRNALSTLAQLTAELAEEVATLIEDSTPEPQFVKPLRDKVESIRAKASAIRQLV